MALTVTFGIKDDDAPLEQGPDASTEDLTIGSSAQVTTTTAGSRHDVVSLLADADCWVVIASKDKLGSEITNSAAGNKRRPIQSGVKEQFAIKPGAGTKVAVIERT